MKSSVKITIITASYNSEKTIEKTLQSVLNQSYPNLEYIIIDGNSKDKTLSIIKSYQNKFDKANIIFKYISERDNGIYDAFNKGLKMATGDLIGIIGSDDWYEHNALKLVANLYNKEAPDFIHGNMNVYAESKKFIKTLKPSSKYLMIKKMTFFHPSSFIKKTVYDDLKGYSLKFDICSDYDLILKIIKRKYIIRHINKNIVNFSYGGVSTTNYKKALKEAHLVRVENGYNKLLSFYFYKQAIFILKIKKILRG